MCNFLVLEIGTVQPSGFTQIVYRHVAYTGRMDILRNLVENNFAQGISACGTVVCEYAAKGNNFEMLKYLRAAGCPWDVRTCMFAAGNGHLEMLKWAMAEGCAYEMEDFSPRIISRLCSDGVFPGGMCLVRRCKTQYKTHCEGLCRDHRLLVKSLILDGVSSSCVDTAEYITDLVCQT